MNNTERLNSHETLEAQLTRLGETIEEKLQDVEPVGHLDDDSNFVGMTYAGQIAVPAHGGYNWLNVTVTVPESDDEPRRYALKDELPFRTPAEWVAGDSQVSFTDTGFHGEQTTQAIPKEELERLTEDIARGHLFDPVNEEVVEVRERGTDFVRYEIVPRKRPGRIQRALGRSARRR